MGWKRCLEVHIKVPIRFIPLWPASWQGVSTRFLLVKSMIKATCEEKTKSVMLPTDLMSTLCIHCKSIFCFYTIYPSIHSHPPIYLPAPKEPFSKYWWTAAFKLLYWTIFTQGRSSKMYQSFLLKPAIFLSNFKVTYKLWDIKVSMKCRKMSKMKPRCTWHKKCMPWKLARFSPPRSH